MGIELARARAPDVIIMDINLPGMSGLDALARAACIARDEGHPGHRAHRSRFRARPQRGKQAGFYRYLTKPVKVEELEGALEELLANRGR